MVYKEVHGNELYVWMNGSLLYKHYLDTGAGVVFCPLYGTFRTPQSFVRAYYAKHFTEEWLKAKNNNSFLNQKP